MKLILTYLAMSTMALAGPPTVKVAWDDPGPEEMAIIEHYRVLIGTESGVYTITLDQPTPPKFTAELGDLIAGQTYFAVCVAVGNFDLVSEYSNEITFTINPKPVPPKNFRYNRRGANVE